MHGGHCKVQKYIFFYLTLCSLTPHWPAHPIQVLLPHAKLFCWLHTTSGPTLLSYSSLAHWPWVIWLSSVQEFCCCGRLRLEPAASVLHPIFQISSKSTWRHPSLSVKTMARVRNASDFKQWYINTRLRSRKYPKEPLMNNLITTKHACTINKYCKVMW